MEDFLWEAGWLAAEAKMEDKQKRCKEQWMVELLVQV